MSPTILSAIGSKKLSMSFLKECQQTRTIDQSNIRRNCDLASDNSSFQIEILVRCWQIYLDISVTLDKFSFVTIELFHELTHSFPFGIVGADLVNDLCLIQYSVSFFADEFLQPVLEGYVDKYGAAFYASQTVRATLPGAKPTTYQLQV